MIAAGVLPSLVGKELRALLLPASACAAAMAVPALLVGAFQWPIWAFLVGAPAVGAMSLGHEYSSRTLAVLLSQPISRQRIYLSKSVAVITTVSLLAALAYVTMPLPFSTRPRLVSWIMWPALGAVCLAPWFTMLTRNAVAGVVFTWAVPSALMGLATAVWDWSVVEAPLFWLVGPVVCGIGATAGWMTFRRLEVPGDDAAGAAVALPLRLRRRPMPIAARAPARHPVLQLVAKELRLQQMALLLCALYGAIWLAALCCAPAWYWGYWWGLTLFYSTFAGLLVGAAASAEERHLGTLEWQLLVPVRSWVQWTVKAAVVFGLALAFSIGVPRVLAQLLAAWGIAGPDPTLTLPLSTMLLVAACGFYASSISRSSLAAVLVSIPTLVAVGTVWAVVVTRLGFLPTAGTEEPFWRLSAATVSALNAVLLAGQFAVITCCAYHNHRRADRSISRVALHLAWMTLYSLAWWLGRLATGGSY